MQDLVPLNLLFCSSLKENPNILKYACYMLTHIGCFSDFHAHKVTNMDIRGEKKRCDLYMGTRLTRTVQHCALAGTSIALLMLSWNSQPKHGDGVVVPFKKR